MARVYCQHELGPDHRVASSAPGCAMASRSCFLHSARIPRPATPLPQCAERRAALAALPRRAGANDTADLVLPHDEGSTFDDPADIRARRALPDAGRDAVHAELLIDDSVVMVKDAQDDQFNALLCTCWPDVDAAWDRACAPARRSSTPSLTTSTESAAAASAIRSATSGCWPPAASGSGPCSC